MKTLTTYAVLGVGALGLSYLIINKISRGIGSIFGVTQREEHQKENEKLLKKIKLNPGGKWSIGKTKDQRIYAAKVISDNLFQRMLGASTLEDYAVVKALIKRLRYKNDLRLVVKTFGVKNGDNLKEWVRDESMPKDWKSYIITRLNLVM